MPSIRVVVRGRVQGVGFRNFTFLTARRLGIAGEVWNRSDGNVELLAEHPEQKSLDWFLDALEAGPGYIRDIQSEPTVERGFEQFTIGPTR
ncbi:MAG TPA: acylphosphatase [Fimbriimonadaceae bacterium]|nr:acylphosphatase [Fimbriimonadaceae bacterium]